ncbi:MAG: M55 family metallopeptidase [candidate division KSB1 bacterium]|jgi:D-amino peptidase|nr:M55 family metallopeptidase [candidate division KSB1 bacterium]
MEKKIFISVDMEGITGVIHWDETEEKHQDYQYFRKIMTQEANAAVEGALEAGASHITVRDAHASARNMLPDMLNEKAVLLREWSTGPYGMMDGLDDTFDAAVCIGYHAKAGTPNGTLKHTMAGVVLDLRVNGISLPELGWNALIAGYHHVPVAFVSGDSAICDQAKSLFGHIATVAVKQGIGKAAVNLHPAVSRKRIREGVKKALTDLASFSPLIYNSPYTIEIDFKDELRTYRASWYPGVKRIGDLTVAMTCEDFFDCMRFFMFAT